MKKNIAVLLVMIAVLFISIAIAEEETQNLFYLWDIPFGLHTQELGEALAQKTTIDFTAEEDENENNGIVRQYTYSALEHNDALEIAGYPVKFIEADLYTEDYSYDEALETYRYFYDGDDNYQQLFMSWIPSDWGYIESALATFSDIVGYYETAFNTSATIVFSLRGDLVQQWTLPKTDTQKVDISTLLPLIETRNTVYVYAYINNIEITLHAFDLSIDEPEIFIYLYQYSQLQPLPEVLLTYPDPLAPYPAIEVTETITDFNNDFSSAFWDVYSFEYDFPEWNFEDELRGSSLVRKAQIDNTYFEFATFEHTTQLEYAFISYPQEDSGLKPLSDVFFLAFIAAMPEKDNTISTAVVITDRVNKFKDNLSLSDNLVTYFYTPVDNYTLYFIVEESSNYMAYIHNESGKTVDDICRKSSISDTILGTSSIALSAGEWECPNHIPAGEYVVTPIKSASIYVYRGDDLRVREYLSTYDNDEIGRLVLKAGDTIEIGSGKLQFTPFE